MSPATRSLVLLSFASFLAMSCWFAGTAVLPQIALQWGAGLGVAAWLTLAVQLGFVFGALLSATFNLPDLFRPTRVFIFSAMLAAAANAGFALFSYNIALAIAMRFLTGAALAGVYPPAMKILTGWFREGRGLALGVLVGALALGSALPHATAALSATQDWREVIFTSSALAVLAALIVMMFVREGPFATPSPPFDPTQIAQAFRNPKLALANLGYLGHMWELYSMWGWIAILLQHSGAVSRAHAEAGAFVAMAAGIFGCIWAGMASDNAPQSGDAASIRQRSRVTIIAMCVSASCCIAIALAFGHFITVMVISIVWGVSVIADSAQFSAIISEVAEHEYVGTALTMQTAVGFALTVISIRVTAWLGEMYGWNIAAASLAIGPAVGVLAMWMLMKKEAAGVSEVS